MRENYGYLAGFRAADEIPTNKKVFISAISVPSGRVSDYIGKTLPAGSTAVFYPDAEAARFGSLPRRYDLSGYTLVKRVAGDPWVHGYIIVSEPAEA